MTNGEVGIGRIGLFGLFRLSFQIDRIGPIGPIAPPFSPSELPPRRPPANRTPMAIDVDTVRRVARLARIHEPEERLEPLAREIDGIVRWIEQLAEVDTDGVEPMTSVVHQPLPLRDDVVTDGGDPARVLSNAPKAEHGFFVVPKVVE